jgi:hypothetical protein
LLVLMVINEQSLRARRNQHLIAVKDRDEVIARHISQ